MPSPTANLQAVVARAADSERLVFAGGSTMTLLADGPGTAGTLSVHHTELRDGADGAGPHHHRTTVEVFYVVGGRALLLLGHDLVEITEGDLAVALPGATHAFAASPGHDAELLVAATPGIERFSLFRRFERVIAGRETAGTLFTDQSAYDTYPDVSHTWQQARRHVTTPGRNHR